MDLVTSISLSVNVVPLSGNPAVQFYEVSVKIASNVKAESRIESTERPLRCLFTGLTPSTEYNIIAKACLRANRDCGRPLGKLVTTPAPKVK